MSDSPLPQRASTEYLKKLAKDRLRQLRKTDPGAKLTTVQLAVAREHGFSSWRSLKAEVERRHAFNITSFLEACSNGDLEGLRGLLAADPSLARAADPNGRYPGWTGLHTAAQQGHAGAVRLLLEQGADPNAREGGDNTYPLHWAVAAGHLESVRLLLKAGSDVHGVGDVHQLDVIGWATFFHEPGRPDAVPLLLEGGARHHIFSALCVGDADLIRELVEEDPKSLERRMSPFEHGLAPLHFCISRQRYDLLELLIELGADLEAEDLRGQSALVFAMMCADAEAVKRLHAAGAKGSKGWTAAPRKPKPKAAADFRKGMAQLAASVKKGVPMIRVPDIARTLDWYVAIGFTEIGRYGDEDLVNFGMLSFGKAQLMLALGGKPGEHDVSLWFYTDRIDDLYQLLKNRQLEVMQAALAGRPGDPAGIEFVEDIHDPFYGGREFGIRDLNGYVLYFMQEG